jgi:hypothetical protein
MPPTRQELEAEIASLIARREQLLAGVERMPARIEDEDTEKRASDLARMLGAALTAADKTRLARNEPARMAQALINSVYSKITEPLTRARKSVLDRLTTYQRVKAEAERRRRTEEARRRAEEAERQRQAAEEASRVIETDADLDVAVSTEELARQAAADAERARQATEAKLAELTRQRGDFGAVASLRTFFDFTDLDRDELDLEKLRAYLPLDALEKAVRAYIRAGGRELRGVTIFENTRTTVR